MKDPLVAVEAVEAATDERVRTVLTSAIIILENAVLMQGRSTEELAAYLVEELSVTEADDAAAIREQADPEMIAFLEQVGVLDADE